MGSRALGMYSAHSETGYSPLAMHTFLSSQFLRLSTPRGIRWVDRTSDFAQSGIPQGILLALSALWTIVIVSRRQKRSPVPKVKASSIRWPFEVLSQASRVASIAFFSLAVVQGRAHLLNVVVLGYGFIVGLLRLVNNLEWRHAGLHQVNLVYSVMLALSAAAHFLPCIQASEVCHRDVSITGGVISLAAAFAVAVTTPRSWKPPLVDSDALGTSVEQEPSPEEICSWFTYYTSYEWMTPVIWKGAMRKLDMSGLPRIAWYDEPLYLLRKLQEARSRSKNTFWTVIRFQRTELTLMTIWISLCFAAENIAPYGMFKLLEYLANPEHITYQPWVWLILLFIGPVSRSLLFQQYIFTSTRLVVRVKSAMTQELYHRALGSMELEDDPFDQQKGGVSGDENALKPQTTNSAGRLANLMAADVDAIYRSRDAIQIVAGVPAGTIISLIGMYQMLGWPSLVGTVVLLLSSPMSMWLGRMMFKVQRVVRKAQDSRISLVTEYLASIRAIKYFAWEDAVTEKIASARSTEQKQLWRVAILQVVINQITQITPFLALLLMFGLHVGVSKQRLDASTAFTSAYLVKNIRRNIAMVSYMFRNFAATAVSLGRIDKYFENTVPLREVPIGPVRIANGCFRRNKKATFSLQDISIDFVQGGLNVVTGQSGSGKTTLLLAILGETYIEGGIASRPDDVAFASQSSWLQNQSIEANILFESPMDRSRYDRVIEACCLDVDLKEIADGDQSLVGENGSSLSGGQRARVALGRALYSKAPLLLLDDIFSALDAKTAAGVWKYCFCTDFLKGRTIILVTQVPWISEQADLAIHLENGRVKSLEPHIGVDRKPITVAEVLGGNDEEEATESEMQPTLDPLNEPTKIIEDKTSKDVVNQEMKASGRITRLTIFQYMGYFGHPLFAVICLLSLVACNFLAFYSNLWLSIWVEAYDRNAHMDVLYYMGIYTLITFSEIFMYGVALILFQWGSWRAARRLHHEFISAVMRVSLSWFKIIPVGRITNRFSGDMTSIDNSVGELVRTFLDVVAQMIFRIVAVSSIMPIFMLPSLFACVFGIGIGELYTRTAVVIKRLMSSAQSPIFSQFGDTLAGLAIIRSRAGMSKTFVEGMAAKARAWSVSAEASFNLNRWVAVRVDFVTAWIALCAGIIAVNKAGVIGAGLVGFSLSNANALSQTILWLIRAMNDLEVEMQSFHRVREYIKVEPEEKDDIVYPEEGQYADATDHIIPHNWPSTGEVEFRNVTIRYDLDGPDILTNVNLKFKAGERVAVVGRTGSGKSTLVLSLLRFTHIVSGQILYDGVDITKAPRRRLREGLTIIPQEAVLFNGTIASNLDPTGHISESTLTKALQHCQGIASFSGTSSQDASDESGDDDRTIQLSTRVDARGENFSHGQRQVLSLSRALIRESKLMLLDEATASMDYETDRGIQQVLRSELEAAGNNRTLVTIAHRLRTIIDYDSVVVMSAGKVVEYGSPRDLYNAKGLFYDMVYHSGETEELQEYLSGESTNGESTKV